MPPESPSEKRDWIERTLLDLREGRASDADARELRQLLMNDREARLIYLRNNQLDGLLEMSGQAAKPSRSTLLQFLSAHRGHVVSAAIGAGIAAVLTLLAVLGPFHTPASSPLIAEDPSTNSSLALLSSDYDAEFGGEAALDSGQFGEGEVALERGIAQLAFRNGAQIVLEGKCGFEIIDEMTVTLTHGKMWAYCPESAYGFKVLTPGGREIIDLGTEFGVEVAASGATDVHVYDGLINVVEANSETQMVEAGHALHWRDSSGPASAVAVDFDKFVTASDLTESRLHAYDSQLKMRDDLVLYYNFNTITGKHVRNEVAPEDKATRGKLHGAITVSGRSRQQRGVLFDDPEDSISLRLDRPKELSAYTIAMWIKVDRIDGSHAPLINSNGWENNDIHFQINQSGALRSGIHGFESFQSKSGCIDPGRWQLVAVSWDFELLKARFSCDGIPIQSKLVRRYPIQPENPHPEFGDCMIGSWGGRPKPYRDQLRDFCGRIDSVMIFDHALSDEELAELYRLGKP